VGKYRVKGSHRFLGHEPGEEFEADLDEGQEKRAVARGSISRVNKKSADAEDTKAEKAEKEKE